MSPDEYVFWSVDDKARVPVGIPADVKQQKVAMPLTERVRLTDHQFRRARGHMLISSVCAAMDVDETKQFGSAARVSNNGQTAVIVRDGKNLCTAHVEHVRFY